MARLISAGRAWAQLEASVDALVESLFEDKIVVGLTVAVTKQGRLILSKGYGFAMSDGTRTRPMTPSMRSKIGSTTKALITGPAAVQLMRGKDIDPSTVTLFGPRGFFDGEFDDDIDVGIQAAAPDSADWKQWYEKITLQHLLDHKAGFQKSGPDRADVAQMFEVAEDEVTLEQELRYFLRTRRLRYEPGNPPEGLEPSSYSNYGFGIWALLIERMSGKPYPNYVRGHYLRPMNLHNAVRWQRAAPDSCDAHGHFASSAQPPQPQPFEQSALGTGLAAGGFMASAQSMTRIMAELANTHTTAELDRMGWGRGTNSNGHVNLSHNGSITGGLASAVMFTAGYRSATENADLSDVHVAVAANVRGPEVEDEPKSLTSDSLRSLANQIALAVPASGAPASFDLWGDPALSPDSEYVRHGVPAAEYQAVFDDADRSGYRLEWIDGYTDGGKLHFNVIFRNNLSGVDWSSRHAMTGPEYQAAYDEHKAAGFALEHVDSHLVRGDVRYAAIWVKSTRRVRAYHDKSLADHQATFDDWTASGWRPKAISVVSVDGALRYTALYIQEPADDTQSKSFLTSQEYQQRYEANKAAGRHLRYLGTYVHDGTVRFSGIWAPTPAVSSSTARHAMTDTEFITEWEDAVGRGFRTRGVTAWESRGRIRYAAFWNK
ncbi:serine hydrolase [Microbacterium sp. NPDC019599]|uniref:serine hydrolase n=1 Tax=Microbacterium sp. NPDC019599 TaxID=3154690 RepID=UPI003409E191